MAEPKITLLQKGKGKARLKVEDATATETFEVTWARGRGGKTATTVTPRSRGPLADAAQAWAEARVAPARSAVADGKHRQPRPGEVKPKKPKKPKK